MTQLYRDVICHNGKFYTTNSALSQCIKEFVNVMAKPVVLRDPDDQEDLENAWELMQALIPEIKGQTPTQVYDYIVDNT